MNSVLPEPRHPVAHSGKNHLAGEVISEFFNAMLDSELPIDALSALVEFLDISDASTANLDALESKSKDDSSLEPLRPEPPIKLARQIFQLSKVCRTELLRAQGFSVVAERVAHSCAEEQTRAQQETSGPVVAGSLTPLAFSERLQESVQAALLRVMEERDTSHTRLVAAEVLHVHKLEQQRKQNARLEAELQASRSEGNSQNADRERQQRHLQMQQSADEELMSMCQQLSGEISARTEASLEVKRLKESHQIESEQHKNEVQALQEEIVRLRGALESEKSKAQSVSTELSGLRRSYRNIVEYESPSKP